MRGEASEPEEIGKLDMRKDGLWKINAVVNMIGGNLRKVDLPLGSGE